MHNPKFVIPALAAGISPGPLSQRRPTRKPALPLRRPMHQCQLSLFAIPAPLPSFLRRQESRTAQAQIADRNTDVPRCLHAELWRNVDRSYRAQCIGAS